MRKYCTIIGLLLVVVLPVCAQNWTPQDSLRLRRLLDGEGEIKLNPERANNMAVGSWQGASGGLGFSGDFMAPFTKEFWNVKGRKRRARTLEVLRAYGDSITVRGKEPVKTIKN